MRNSQRMKVLLMTVVFERCSGEEALNAMAIAEQLLLQVGNEPENVSDGGLAQLGFASAGCW